MCLIFLRLFLFGHNYLIHLLGLCHLLLILLCDFFLMICLMHYLHSLIMLVLLLYCMFLFPIPHLSLVPIHIHIHLLLRSCFDHCLLLSSLHYLFLSILVCLMLFLVNCLSLLPIPIHCLLCLMLDYVCFLLLFV